MTRPSAEAGGLHEYRSLRALLTTHDAVSSEGAETAATGAEAAAAAGALLEPAEEPKMRKQNNHYIIN